MFDSSYYSYSEDFKEGDLVMITGSSGNDKIGCIYSSLLIETPMGPLAQVITNTTFGMTWLWYATRCLVRIS